MIELTQEQVQSLGNPAAAPPRVLHPQTHETFVLVPLADYERLVAESDDSPWTEVERYRLRWDACEMLDAFGKNVGLASAAIW